jgi:hypothetical protein
LKAPTCAARCPSRLRQRERHPAGKGGTEGEKWLMNLAVKWRIPRHLKGSLTCRKSATCDRRLYFPSEGRHAEDFFRPEKSDGFGRVRTREFGSQRPAC